MLGYIILFWNLIVFLMYYADKKKSMNNKWRIKEKALLLSGICLGGVGAFLGMYIFHHKTLHRRFTVLIPVSAILTIYIYLKFA